MSDQQAKDDLYWPIDLGDDDVRVELAGWIFYIRAVKTRRELLGNALASSGSLLGDLVIVPLMVWGYERWRARRPWQVGVVRLPSPSTWVVTRIEVVHIEQVPAGTSPAVRIQTLADEVRTGAFLPAR